MNGNDFGEMGDFKGLAQKKKVEGIKWIGGWFVGFFLEYNNCPSIRVREKKIILFFYAIFCMVKEFYLGQFTGEKIHNKMEKGKEFLWF